MICRSLRRILRMTANFSTVWLVLLSAQSFLRMYARFSSSLYHCLIFSWLII